MTSVTRFVLIALLATHAMAPPPPDPTDPPETTTPLTPLPPIVDYTPEPRNPFTPLPHGQPTLFPPTPVPFTPVPPTPTPPTPTPPTPVLYTPMPPTPLTSVPPTPVPWTPIPPTPPTLVPPTPVPPTPVPRTPTPPTPTPPIPTPPTPVPPTPIPPTPPTPVPPTPVPPTPVPSTPTPPTPSPPTPVPPTPIPPTPPTPVPPTPAPPTPSPVTAEPSPEPEEPCQGSCLRNVCATGAVFQLLIEGTNTANVWGTGKYSDDSDVGGAAVHAGMVAAGERATLTIKCFGAVASFTGSVKNGVASQNWAASVPSFGFVGDETIGETPEPPSAPTRPDTCYSDQCLGGRCNAPGHRFSMIVEGKATGTAYGENVYTDDSSVGLAAVHAGVLAAGETGVVKVECVRGRSNYPGSTRNGVTSTPYPFPWRFAFRLRQGAALPAPPPPDTCRRCMRFLCRDALKSAVITVRGSSYNRIWGTDVYSGDSDPSVAAVHASLAQIGEEKTVKVLCRGPQSAFEGSIRNEVKSRQFNKPYGSSYELVAVDIEQEAATPCEGACLTPECQQPGSTFKLRVTGNANVLRRVWGGGDDEEPYTSDSDVQAAAVMSGLVAEGETADLQVKCTGPRESFGCRTKNGVESLCFAQRWDSSYRFTRRFGG